MTALSSTSRTATPVPDAVPGAKSSRWGWWYVTEHHIRRLRSYAQTVIVTAFGTPLLYLFAMGVGLSTLISANGTTVDGVSYLTFVAPALLCSAALTAASEEFSYTVMTGFKWNPVYVGMHATPISGRQIVSGLITFVTLRLTVTCTVYFVIMELFGAVPSAWGALGIVAAVATGLAFGTPLMAYCCSLKEDGGRIAMVMRFIVVPMTLFSGTMFPITQLPIYLQPLGWISPLWHGSQLARTASYGMAESTGMIAVHVAVLVVFAAGGWLAAGHVATKRLDA